MATPSLRVLHGGLGTTIQDLGRRGSRRWGVPQSGALDPDSLRRANVVVGNEPDEAAFELLGGELALEVQAEAVRVALASFDGHLTIEGHLARRVPSWQATTLRRGERLRCHVGNGSACSYLSIGAGLDVPTVLGSRSTYLRGAFGGWQGRALRAGDTLPLRVGEISTTPMFRARRTSAVGGGLLRVVPGPHLDRLVPGALDELCAGEYVVTPATDRMGLRLAGPALEARTAATELVSCPTVPGTIQVPPDGRPIALSVDCQTTGGYPIVAVVCSADLSRLGRTRPGDRVRFAVISLDEARDAGREHEADLRRALLDVDVIREPSVVPRALYQENLVGGIVDANEDAPGARTPPSTSPDGDPQPAKEAPCPVP